MRKIVKNVHNCATSALGAKHINELVFISVMQSANIALELARQLDIYLYIVQYMYLFYFALERQHYGGAVGIARIVDQIQYDTIFSQKISEQMKYNIIMLLM